MTWHKRTGHSAAIQFPKQTHILNTLTVSASVAFLTEDLWEQCSAPVHPDSLLLRTLLFLVFVVFISSVFLFFLSFIFFLLSMTLCLENWCWTFNRCLFAWSFLLPVLSLRVIVIIVQLLPSFFHCALALIIVLTFIASVTTILLHWQQCHLHCLQCA